MKTHISILLFFKERKHGQVIHKLLKGKWDLKKAETYLDNLAVGDIKWARIIDSIAKDLRVNVISDKNYDETIRKILAQMESTYKVFLTIEN